MKKFILLLLPLLALFCVAATPPVKNPVWVGGTDSRIYEGSGLKYYPNGSTNSADAVYSLADLVNASTNTTINIQKLNNTGASAGDVIGFDGNSNLWVATSGVGAFTNVVNLGTGTNVAWMAGRSLMVRSISDSAGIDVSCADGSNIVIAVKWADLKATNDTYYASLTDFTTLSGTVSGHTTAISTLQGGTNQWNIAVTNVVTDVPFLQFLIANNVATLSTNTTRIPYEMIAAGTATNKQALVYNGATGLWEPQDQTGTGGSDPNAITNLVSTGSGTNLIKQVADKVGTMKSIVGAGTTVISDDGDTITVTSSGGVGTVTNAANVGSGVGMFSDLTDGVLNFKSLRSNSSAITIGDTPTNAVVDVDWGVFAATNNILYARLGAENTFSAICTFNTNVNTKTLIVSSIKRNGTPFAIQNSDAGGSLFTVVEGSTGNGGFNVYDSAWTARINGGAAPDGGYFRLYDGSGNSQVYLNGGTTNYFLNRVALGTNGAGAAELTIRAGDTTRDLALYCTNNQEWVRMLGEDGNTHYFIGQNALAQPVAYWYDQTGTGPMIKEIAANTGGAISLWNAAGAAEMIRLSGGGDSWIYPPVAVSNLLVQGTATFSNAFAVSTPSVASIYITNQAALNNTTTLPVLRLGRPIQMAVKYPESAEFRIGTWTNGYVNSCTKMDIALDNGTSQVPDTTIMTLFANGNVGFSTNAPSATLHVNGTGLFENTLTANNGVISTNPYVGVVSGPAFMGSIANGTVARFANTAMTNDYRNYMIQQDNTGATIVNATSGKTINFAIYGSNKGSLNSDGTWTFGGNTTINGSLTSTNGLTVSAGATSLAALTAASYNGYTWPGSDGGSNYVMVTDGAGHLSFAQVGGVAGIVLTGQGYLDAENSTLNLRSLAGSSAAINFYSKGGANTNEVVATFKDTGDFALSNKLCMVSNVIEGHVSATALPSQVIDLYAAPKQTWALTNSVTLSFTNLPTASQSISTSLKIVADGSTRSVIVPNEFGKLSGANTNSLAANKFAILSVTYFGNNPTNAVMSWAPQP